MIDDNFADKTRSTLPEGFGDVECRIPVDFRVDEHKQLIGLVIPTFKRPEYLKSCLDSLAKSTLDNTVLVIVDESTAGQIQLFDDYVFHYGADQDGYDLRRVDGNIEEIKEACDRHWRCTAFNTNGWLKRRVKKLNYRTSDCYDFGIYIKSKGSGGFIYPNCQKANFAQSLHRDVDQTVQLVSDFALETVPLVKITKYKHGNMYESLRIGWDLLIGVFNCDYLCCLDSDTVVKKEWLARLTEVDQLARKARAERFVISTGFNSNKHLVTRTCDRYFIKDTVGGINLLFRQAEYQEIVRPSLDQVNWDWSLVDQCRKREGVFICTKPSVIQHIGEQGLWSRGKDFDRASDFFSE